jgi:hypothetical protein
MRSFRGLIDWPASNSPLNRTLLFGQSFASTEAMARAASSRELSGVVEFLSQCGDCRLYIGDVAVREEPPGKRQHLVGPRASLSSDAGAFARMRR